MRNITKQEFKQWLEGFHPRTKVGHCWSAMTCPLARALNQLNEDVDVVEVRQETISFYLNDEWYNDIDRKTVLIKPWQAEFIKQVDDAAQRNYVVTAARALRYLEKC